MARRRVPTNAETFGLGLSSTDFNKVLSQEISTPFFVSIDLTNARTIAAGTALELPIAGNVFYADPSSVAGQATVRFSDTRLSGPGAPFTVGSGFIIKVPFNKVLIENTAQPGRTLNIIYGVDLDFLPGAGQNVNATIVSPLSLGWVGTTTNVINGVYVENFAGQISTARNYQYVQEMGTPANATSYKSTTGMAANTPDTILAPGSNVNGAIVWDGGALSYNATNVAVIALLAKTSAPTTVLDGDVLGVVQTPQYFTGAFGSTINVLRPKRVSAGKGLYAIASIAETGANRAFLYTAL